MNDTRCDKCRQDLPLENYYLFDGVYDKTCKGCRNAAQRENYRNKRKEYSLSCLFCKKNYISSRKNSQTCTRRCKEKYKYETTSAIAKDRVYISPATRGAISEYKVSSFLMVNGYDVFRSMSPSSFCDLVVIKDNVVKKIDVKTGYVSVSGKVTYIKNKLRNGGFPDLYAVVDKITNDIYFFNHCDGKEVWLV